MTDVTVVERENATRVRLDNWDRMSSLAIAWAAVEDWSVCWYDVDEPYGAAYANRVAAHTGWVPAYPLLMPDRGPLTVEFGLPGLAALAAGDADSDDPDAGDSDAGDSELRSVEPVRWRSCGGEIVHGAPTDVLFRFGTVDQAAGRWLTEREYAEARALATNSCHSLLNALSEFLDEPETTEPASDTADSWPPLGGPRSLAEAEAAPDLVVFTASWPRTNGRIVLWVCQEHWPYEWSFRLHVEPIDAG